MLNVKNLNFSYNNKKLFFNNLSVSISSSNITALIGPNGCGKTTLLKNIANQFKPISAEIYYENINLQKLDNKQRAKKLSYMSQHNQNVDNITSLDTIMLGRKPYIKYNYTKKDFDMASEFIQLLKLENILENSFNSLSGGEKQRVMLAKALMQEPKILLLDEPNNHLDPKNQIEALQLIEYISKKYKLITIIVLHDINLAFRFANKVIMMKNTKIINQLNTNEIKKEDLEKIYDMDIDFIKTSNHKIVIFNPNNKKLFKDKT